MDPPVPLIRNLDEILSENLGRKVEVVSQSSKYLTAPGDNYGSTMLALEAKIKDSTNGEEEELSLVAKMVPPVEALWKVFQTLVTFKKENDMYTVTGPELLQLERDMGIPEEELLDVFPKCYGARLSLNPDSPVDKDALLLLENLKNTEYSVGERTVGFDEKEAKLVLKYLAHFHAVPIALRIHRPDIFAEKVLPTTLRADLNYGMKDVVGGWMAGTIEALSSIPEVYPYMDRIKAAFTLNEQYQNNPPPPKEPFASIVHNDFWVNNMMLKYDTNQNPYKVKIVDYQLTMYDSAVQDLLFFIYTSVIDSVRKGKYQELVQYYHKHLTNYLKRLNCNMADFSLDKLDKEIEEQAPAIFAKIILMLKVVMAEKHATTKGLSEFDGSVFSSQDNVGRAYTDKLRGVVLDFADKKWL